MRQPRQSCNDSEAIGKKKEFTVGLDSLHNFIDFLSCERQTYSKHLLGFHDFVIVVSEFCNVKSSKCELTVKIHETCDYFSRLTVN